MVTVSQNSIIFERFKISRNFSKLDSSKQQININTVKDHFNCWNKRFSYFNQKLRFWLIFQNRWKKSKKVPIPINMPWCYHQSIDVCSLGVHIEPIWSKIKKLSTGVINDILAFPIKSTALLDPFNDDVFKFDFDHDSYFWILFWFIIIEIFFHNTVDFVRLLLVPVICFQVEDRAEKNLCWDVFANIRLSSVWIKHFLLQYLKKYKINNYYLKLNKNWYIYFAIH